MALRVVIKSARCRMPGLADGRVHTDPGRLVRGELLPQVGYEFRDLLAGHAVLEGGHIAQIAGHGRCDPMQDHLDQIVRPGTMQIAVERQRGPATEQNGAPDRMANSAGAFVQPGADRRCRNDPDARRVFQSGGERVLRCLTDRDFVE